MSHIDTNLTPAYKLIATPRGQELFSDILQELSSESGKDEAYLSMMKAICEAAGRVLERGGIVAFVESPDADRPLLTISVDLAELSA